jgi:DNA-binding transcriptional regulator YdaS (Cro superfamily)
MTLTEWIKAEGITATEAARRFGVAHTTVGRWRGGWLFPSRPHLLAIHRVTNGAVTPADFLRFPGAPASSQVTDCEAEPCRHQPTSFASVRPGVIKTSTLDRGAPAVSRNQSASERNNQ